MTLDRQKCRPCEGGVLRLSRKEALGLLKEVPGWELSADGLSIFREHRMKDFSAAVAEIGKIAGIAEKEGHHPDIHLTGYRKLKIELSTHAIRGLSRNDFILASKIDKLPKKIA